MSESIKMPDTGDKECEWCGNHVDVLHEHHFPLPKRMGGTDVVHICKNCHDKFHILEYQNSMGVYSSMPKTKDKDKEKQKAADVMFETLWKMYPKKLGKGSVKPNTKLKLLDVGFDQLKSCIDRYKDYIKGKDEQYVMYGSTFFNSGYVDYLDENYALATQQEQPQQDDNFPFV